MSDVPTGLRKHKIKHKRGQPLKEKREKEKEGSTLESEILIMRIPTTPFDTPKQRRLKS